MYKNILIVAAIFTMGSAYSQKTVIHDANAQERSIGTFSAIKISDGIDLYLTQGDDEGVAVSATDSKERDRIKVYVENGVLKIGRDQNGWKLNSGNKNMKAYVSFRSIRQLTASGASDVYVNGTVKGDELNLKLSGASDFKGSVQLQKLTVDQSGASDVKISGAAAVLDVQLSGASNLKGYELETQQCMAKASGASELQLTVNKELNAQASGASSINYKGGGIVREMHTSGASNVNKRG